jgi:hypothetical protein
VRVALGDEQTERPKRTFRDLGRDLPGRRPAAQDAAHLGVDQMRCVRHDLRQALP